ncbi:Cytochrome bo(3) ubiquinol oxidase subunit 4 [Buchnera aphidicola (Eriosoma grossulariae)]|uniref:cytochrome C oxidase subunit IV family protein n=1 Tax=Buchnera aphidicola TaxID=9 RepID=UPI003464497C
MNFKKNNYSLQLINDLKKFYCIGLLLSMIFTLIPFYLVTKYHLSKIIIISIILIFCFLQILVHFRYFFNFNTIDYDIWSIVFIIFTIIVILIIISGSIWIMYNLNHHLMIH